MASPKKIKSIRAKVNKLLCPSSMKGITIMGVVYTKKKEVADEINKTEGIDTVFENHEMTHVHQAVSTWNSWICFYILYLSQWLYNIPLVFIDSYAPYKFMPLELEAYATQEDMQYNIANEKATRWKQYRKLPMKTRKELARNWYEIRRKEMSFTEFINEYVNIHLH